jgi:hypothetical protein
VPDQDLSGKSRDKATVKKNSQYEGNHGTYMETSGHFKRKLTEEESLEIDRGKDTHNKIVIGEPINNLLYKPRSTAQLDSYISMFFLVSKGIGPRDRISDSQVGKGFAELNNIQFDGTETMTNSLRESGVSTQFRNNSTTLRTNDIYRLDYANK